MHNNGDNNSEYFANHNDFFLLFSPSRITAEGINAVPRFYCLGAFFAPEKESDFLLSPLYS
jgi:hypothetical protein